MYLRSNVYEGQLITARDLSRAPLLYSDTLPWFAFKTPADAVRKGVIDAKTRGQVCSQSDTVVAGEVIAISCPTEKGPNCIALIRTGDSTKLASLFADQAALDNAMFKPSCK